MNNQELTIKIAIDTMTKSDSAKVNIRLGEYFRPIADHNAIIDLTVGTNKTETVDSLRRADPQILAESIDACDSLIVALRLAQGAQRETQLDREAIDHQQFAKYRQQLEQNADAMPKELEELLDVGGEHGGNPEGDAIS
jgi:hypothetical protein